MREVVNLLIGCLRPCELELALDKIDKEIGVLGMGREDDWIRKVEDLDWARDRIAGALQIWEKV